MRIFRFRQYAKRLLEHYTDKEDDVAHLAHLVKQPKLFDEMEPTFNDIIVTFLNHFRSPEWLFTNSRIKTVDAAAQFISGEGAWKDDHDRVVGRVGDPESEEYGELDDVSLDYDDDGEPLPLPIDYAYHRRLVNFLNQHKGKDYIYIYRALGLPEDIGELEDNLYTYGGVGQYWSYDLAKAQAYNSEYGDEVVVKAKVKVCNVDWQSTLFKSLWDMSSECEIVVASPGTAEVVSYLTRMPVPYRHLQSMDVKKYDSRNKHHREYPVKPIHVKI